MSVSYPAPAILNDRTATPRIAIDGSALAWSLEGHPFPGPPPCDNKTNRRSKMQTTQQPMNPAHRRRLFCSGLAVLAMTQSGCAAAPPLPTPPKVTAPASATGRTPPRVDPSHPLRIGEQYYPPESRRLQEEGICMVRIEVDSDGHIRATQLLSSSGFDRLNAACVASFADGRLIPATVDGKPVSVWVAIPIVWKLADKNFDSTPQIRADYQLKIGPDNYPPLSLKLHQEGDCVVHVTVGIDGTLSGLAVIKSTGYEPLDQACLSAVSQAPFVPARLSGTPFAASTEINISWRFPWPETPAP